MSRAPSGRDARDVIALIDGPRAGEWYWAEDWATRRDATTAMGWTVADVPGWALGYAPTGGRRVPHPKIRDILGRPYAWRP